MRDPAPPSDPAAPSAPRASRRPDARSLSIASAVLLLTALMLGNAVLSRTLVRADLTQDGLFTLSDASRRVLGGLTDECRIRVYWGEKIPASAAPVRRRLEGLLDEYASASNGRLSVTWVKMDEAGEREAGEKGIFEGQFQVFSANEVSAAKAHHGLAIFYEDRMERVGPLADVTEDQTQYQVSQSIEYEITAKIYKVSRTKKAIVGIVSDAPPMSFMNPGAGDRFSVLTTQVLEEMYGNDLRRSVTLDDPVPAEITTLLVLAPKEWPEKRVYHFEQFLLRGGKALVLLDPVDVRVAWGGQPPSKTGLEDWLAAVGVEALPGVLADFDPKGMNMVLLQDGRATGYPFWPRLQAEFLDPSNPATKGFSGVPLYWPVEISVDDAKQKAAGRTATVLATTSAKGWRKDSTFGLDRVEPSAGRDLARRPVLVAVEGPFTSFWKGKLAPGEASPAPPEGEAPGMEGEAPAMADAPPAPPVEGPAPAMTEAPSAPEAPEAPKVPEAPEAPKVPEAPEAPKAPEAPEAPEGVKGPEGEEGAAAPADPAPPAGPARLDEGRGVLVVLGDADLVSDDFSGMRRRDVTGGVTNLVNGVGGFYFVPNVLDWLTGSDDLISLRARGVRSRKLAELEPATAEGVKLANYLAAPLAVLIAGLLVYFVRRYRS